jgi:CHAT domain-containing protein
MFRALHASLPSSPGVSPGDPFSADLAVAVRAHGHPASRVHGWPTLTVGHDGSVGVFVALIVAFVGAVALAAPARAADFGLGVNAEKEACRAVERFDAPRGGAAVDIYCGAWERPSGFVIVGPADPRAASPSLAADCPGEGTAVAASDLADLRQIPCPAPARGGTAGLRRYGLVARSGGRTIFGVAFPADWAALVTAARVLSGAQARAAAAAGSTPGLAEIEAAYPAGLPGQGAQFNYELLRRRAFERNMIWTFGGAESDFEALLRAHDAVSPDDGAGRAAILAEIGLNLSDSRRFADAEETLARASALAAGADDPLLAGKIANYRALDALNQRRFAAARDMALAANALRASGRAGAGGAAISAADARRVDRATPKAPRQLLVEFDDQSVEERSAVLSAQGWYIAGVAARSVGDGAAAGYLAKAAGELTAVRAPPAWLTAAIAGEDARERLAAGDAAGAASRLGAALAEVRLIAPGTRAEAHLLLDLERTQAALGGSDAALASGRSAMAIFARQLEAPGLPAELAAGHLGLLLAKWNGGHDGATADEFFEALALTWDGAAARSAAQLAARLALGGAGKEARSYQDAERAWRAAVAARERLSLSPAPAGEIARADALVAATDTAYHEAEDALRAAAPAYLELINPSLAAADLKGALADKEGYLRLAVAADGGFGALVTREGVTPFAIAAKEGEIDALAARLRRTTAFHGRRLPAYDLDAAAALDGEVIAPAAPAMAGLERVQVDVSGVLASVPFAALVVSPPSAAAAGKAAEGDYTGIDWLSRHVGLATALGPASFVRFRKALAARAAPAASLVAFGDFRPDPALAAARLAQARGLTSACQVQVARVLGSLPALPDTAGEASGVAKAFGGAAHLGLGPEFTDAAFETSDDVSSAEVILLATHGVLGLSPCFPEPALLTSVGASGEGLIEASRLLDRRLDARLVILSACDTAGGSLAEGGDALSGLARGFLYAGAADVMATQWKIDSAASAGEVTAFLAAADKPGASFAGALASAQKSLYDSPETAHPFYWAAFILVGDGAARLEAHGAETVASAGR